jgi:hypothetical protein
MTRRELWKRELWKYVDLQPRDILQVNATVIAGGLIFLSLLGAEGQSRAGNSAAIGFALIIMITFSTSSILCLLRRVTNAITCMMGGFGLLVIFSFIILAR